MKIAISFLLLGLLVGLVGPYLLDRMIVIVSGTDITLPGFSVSTSPQTSFSVDVPTVFRAVGIVFVVFAIVWFAIVRRRHVR